MISSIDGDDISVKSLHMKPCHVIDRCLDAASLCVTQGNAESAKDLMRSKFREAAIEVSLWELGGVTKAGLFLRPMERELVKRHGPVIGREIYWDFVDSFWLQSWTAVPLEDAKLVRPVEQTREWHWRLMAHRSLKKLLGFNHDLSSHLNLD